MVVILQQFLDLIEDDGEEDAKIFGIIFRGILDKQDDADEPYLSVVDDVELVFGTFDDGENDVGVSTPDEDLVD